jgi:hypothetical protein
MTVPGHPSQGCRSITPIRTRRSAPPRCDPRDVACQAACLLGHAILRVWPLAGRIACDSSISVVDGPLALAATIDGLQSREQVAGRDVESFGELDDRE